MISIAHPTSNANSRNTALALQKSGQLQTFYTCLSWDKNSIINNFLPKGVVGELSRRSFPSALNGKIKTYPYYELARLSAQKMGWNGLSQGRYSIHQIYKSFGKYVASQLKKSNDIEGIHCYEDGALEIFEVAKGSWAKTLALDVPEWLQDRKENELELADRIIVPSEFVKKSLLSYHPNLESKVNICAYGAPISSMKKRMVQRQEKIKVLFVGSIGPRKGDS